MRATAVFYLILVLAAYLRFDNPECLALQSHGQVPQTDDLQGSMFSPKPESGAGSSHDSTASVDG